MIAKRFARNILLATVAMAPSFPAFAQGKEAEAQQADQDSGALEDIIVTADRRSQSVQSSSLAISVASGEDVLDAGVVQVRDLGKLEPGVIIGQGGPSTQIYVRGVGDFGATSTSNPAVAFNVDGVYVSRPNSIEGNFLDIQRIEVLKGPQGTLYGRNASGGAINVITNQPKFDETHGHVDVITGSYRHLAAEGFLNVPLSQTLAVRGSFQIVSRNGYATQGFDDDHHESFRLSLLWEPSDTLSFRLTGDHTHVGGLGPAFVFKGPLLPSTQALLTAANIALPTNPRTVATDPAFAPLHNAALATAGGCYPDNVIPVASATNAGVLGAGIQGFCPPGFSNLLNPAEQSLAGNSSNFHNLTLTATADLGFAELTMIPSYRRVRTDNITFPLINADQSKDGSLEVSDTYSIEARLGNSSPSLKWTLGAYFYREDQSFALGSVSPVLGDFTQASVIETTSKALFGQATYSLTDSLRAIAGGRYSWDSRAINGSRSVDDTPLAFPYSPFGQCFLQASPCVTDRWVGSKSLGNFSYKVGLEYDVGPQNMLFITYATGQKAGGFNEISTLGSTTNEARAYDPEKLGALTIGSRNRFLDSKLQVNVEGFYWKYKDSQQSFVTQNSQGQDQFGTTNAGQATIYGFDFDIVGKLTSADTIHFGVEYLHSNFDSFVYIAQGLTPETTGCGLSNVVVNGVPAQQVNCTGMPLMRAPKWSGSASYSHVFDLGEGRSVDFKLSGQFASSRFLGTDYTPGVKAEGYISGDVNLTYDSGKSWTLSAYVRNLNDAKIYTGSFTLPSLLPGLVAANIGAPRTFGVRLGVDF